MVKGVIGACIGGAIGAAIWAAIVYFTGYEVGFIAWAVGGLVGFGMAAGARNDTSNVTGGVAAIIAIVALLVGKYSVVSLYVDKHFAKQAMSETQVTMDDAKKLVAWQLVDEYKSDGKPLAWPDGQTEDTAELPEHFPKDLWTDLEARWASLTPTQQEGYRLAAEEQFKQALSAVSGAVKEQGFLATFGLLDILFFLLAIGTAFKVGAGSGGGGDD